MSSAFDFRDPNDRCTYCDEKYDTDKCYIYTGGEPDKRVYACKEFNLTDIYFYELGCYTYSNNTVRCQSIERYLPIEKLDGLLLLI